MLILRSIMVTGLVQKESVYGIGIKTNYDVKTNIIDYLFTSTRSVFYGKISNRGLTILTEALLY